MIEGKRRRKKEKKKKKKKHDISFLITFQQL